MLYEIENNGQVPQGIRSFAKASTVSGAKELPAIQETCVITIADLDGQDHILARHVSEAVQYRTLDRNMWMK